ERRRLTDRSIWASPARLPVVHTLVARNSRSPSPRRDVISPTTSSERPYMGEESTSLPPSWTKQDRTSSRGRRFASVGWTSKVCQVPRPMTGSFSPEDGIGRVSIVARVTNRDSETDDANALGEGPAPTPRDVPISRPLFALNCFERSPNATHVQPAAQPRAR